MTLVGIADPQAQGGGGAVIDGTRAGSRKAPALEPAPAPGFAGAAALDAQGGSPASWCQAGRGRGTRSAAAALMPVEAMRTLLAEENVAPAPAIVTGTEAAKESVVRMIE